MKKLQKLEATYPKDHDRYNQYYLGEFKPSKRDIRLYERIVRYFKETEGLDNKQCNDFRFTLKQWSVADGYSWAEIKECKKLVQSQRVR